MERRLKMMIAGSIAVWVPVATPAQAASASMESGRLYRLKASRPGSPGAESQPTLPAPHNFG